MKFILFSLSLIGFVGAKTCADYDVNKCTERGEDLIDDASSIICGDAPGNGCRRRLCCTSSPKTCARFNEEICPSGSLVDSPGEVLCDPNCNRRTCCHDPCDEDPCGEFSLNCNINNPIFEGDYTCNCDLTDDVENGPCPDPCDVLDCDDGNDLTMDTCNSNTGCNHECTVDLVDGECVDPGCTSNSACDDFDATTDDFCVNGSCMNTPIVDECDTLDCDDGNDLTTDTCVDGSCNHECTVGLIDGECVEDVCTPNPCGNDVCYQEEGIFLCFCASGGVSPLAICACETGPCGSSFESCEDGNDGDYVCTCPGVFGTGSFDVSNGPCPVPP